MYFNNVIFFTNIPVIFFTFKLKFDFIIVLMILMICKNLLILESYYVT